LRRFALFLVLAACSQSQDFSTVLEPAPASSGTSADPSHTAPPAPPCTIGQCVPTVLVDKMGLDAEHPDSQGTFAVAADETFVYFMTTWSELYRIARKGGKPELLAQTESSPST